MPTPFEQLPSVRRDLVALAAQSGEPFALNRLGGQQAQQVGQSSSQAGLFGRAVQDLLTQHQQLGTRPFQEQALAGQEEQIRRLRSTPQELIGAAPNIQAGVRSAAVGAVEPTIQSAQQSQRTFGEQLQGFRQGVQDARSLVKDFEEADRRQKDEFRSNLDFYIKTGGSRALEDIIKNAPEALKVAGLDPKTVQSVLPYMKEVEEREKLATQKTREIDLGNRVVIVDQNNKIVSEFKKGLPPAKITTGGVGVGVSGEGKLSKRAQGVYDNPTLIQNFTPTERGKILTEITNSGLDTTRFSLPQINATQREQVALFDEIEQEAQGAAEIYRQGINTGPIASRVKRGATSVGLAPRFTELRSVIDNMGSILLRMRSGAAVTPQEFERIRGFIPSINEDETTASKKIDRFFQAIAGAKDNYIKRATQTSFEIQQNLQRGFGQEPNRKVIKGKTYIKTPGGWKAE